MQRGLEQYPVKILMALVQSIAGRKDFFRWLMTAGYPQLGAFSNAVRGDEEAMVWLFKNDYAWLAILSIAIDGDSRARQWISKACTPVHIMFALACRDEVPALQWLQRNRKAVFILMAREVHKVLETQAAENAGPYVMHFGGNSRVVQQMTQWLEEQKKNG